MPGRIDATTPSAPRGSTHAPAERPSAAVQVLAAIEDLSPGRAERRDRHDRHSRIGPVAEIDGEAP
jgi:hypothetical protein